MQESSSLRTLLRRSALFSHPQHLDHIDLFVILLLLLAFLSQATLLALQLLPHSFPIRTRSIA